MFFKEGGGDKIKDSWALSLMGVHCPLDKLGHPIFGGFDLNCSY
jgi:hypothetical protein